MRGEGVKKRPRRRRQPVAPLLHLPRLRKHGHRGEGGRHQVGAPRRRLLLPSAVGGVCVGAVATRRRCRRGRRARVEQPPRARPQQLRVRLVAHRQAGEELPLEQIRRREARPRPLAHHLREQREVVREHRRGVVAHKGRRRVGRQRCDQGDLGRRRRRGRRDDGLLEERL
ncbi:hypothetical protein BU14_1622s0002 [Porphyra umbilicalis]|uniref:Uncharacterized protein n=1 Tax=Porphyra umbilicalis TaxID=2786 RepID=A0A1X6NLB5_PORUM|nr:hypothetical protein BU14_1622s0002 [Porphyra umbilicalis]|eukprot:OSX69320.1 hypothetical protein BU14_1622s0002 [Porphyra umbilicalis]